MVIIQSYEHPHNHTIRYIQIPVLSSDAESSTKQMKTRIKYCQPTLDAAKAKAAECLGVSISSIGVLATPKKDDVRTTPVTSGDISEVASPSRAGGLTERKSMCLSSHFPRKGSSHTHTSTKTVSVCDRKDSDRCHEYETHFNALVHCDDNYEVSQHERDNAVYRGIAVTLVSKFSVELREDHHTPITAADVKFSEPPHMVGNCRMYRWFGSHRFLYVKVLCLNSIGIVVVVSVG